MASSRNTQNKARKRGNAASGQDVASVNFYAGSSLLAHHPMFGPLWAHVRVVRSEGNGVPHDGWARVSSNGTVAVHARRRGAPEEWLYVLAHCLLHLGFGHFQERPNGLAWNVACDVVAARFLSELKLGRAPDEMAWLARDEGLLPATRDEEKLYRFLCENGVPDALKALGTAGLSLPDMKPEERESDQWWGHKVDWPACFGRGLAQAVQSAVRVAGGAEASLGGSETRTLAQSARDWFISSYPLLGALASAFTIIEDPLVCQRMSISIAAVDMESREIFINPAAGLDEHECRFVMAHEILHVGLRHDVRREGRDAYLWNVACDFVINAWLREMGLGEMPAVGGLYDAELKSLSAEAIYDRIVSDLRRYRKLATMRGIGLSDILERPDGEWWRRGDGVALDEWYRSCLAQGLAYHEEGGRGLLPSGLIEEIRALSVPPIAWDVELAQWFDRFFPPLERVRSFARLSRRQSSTPDIPRPRFATPQGELMARTFGVVLDTSGSMDRRLLAKALGAIASYSLAREVPAARVVFCDAEAYDQGYMPPQEIAERVRVRGRGGTVLQPGIDLLEQADDFPPDGPLLIITDGFCDRVRIKREHAFLLPKGHALPFPPKGPTFRLE